MSTSKSSNVLEPIRLAYQASSLPAWWLQVKQDLLSFVPASWQELLGTVDRRLGVLMDDQQLRFFKTQQIDTTELGQLPWQDADVIQQLDQRFSLQTSTPIILLLDSKQVLRRQLNLPLAAEAKLREVLGFEIDRQTPFSLDQVYFEHRVLERNPLTKQCKVELVVVAKAFLEKQLQTLGPLAARISGVDVFTEQKQLLNINLLPTNVRAKQSQQQRWQRWALALGGICLLVLAMNVMLNNRQHALDEWTEKVAKAKVQARQASVFRQQLQRAKDADVFLKKFRAEQPTMLALLNDLTQRIPDDTALDKISVNEGRLVLVGQSKQAAALVGQLQSSPLLQGPALAGAVQPDARTGRDRFTLTATVGSSAQQVKNGQP
jgi:general secretion pathway protein L